MHKLLAGGFVDRKKKKIIRNVSSVSSPLYLSGIGLLQKPSACMARVCLTSADSFSNCACCIYVNTSFIHVTTIAFVSFHTESLFGWLWLSWQHRMRVVLMSLTASNEEATVTLIALSSPPESFSLLECLISILSAWRAGGGHTAAEFSLSVCLLSLLSTSLSSLYSFSHLSLCFSSHSLAVIRACRDKRKNNRSHVLSASAVQWVELHWILFLTLTLWS